MDSLLTVHQVAAYLACSQGEVLRLVRRGQLVAIRSGRQLRFRPEEIAAYLDRARQPDKTSIHELARVQERTTRLQEVTAALAAALTPEDVAQVMIDQGITALGAYAGALVLRQEDAPLLDVLISQGYPPGSWNGDATLPLSAPLPISDAARTGEAIWLTNGAAYVERYPHLSSAAHRSAAIAALPLRSGGRVIGALGLSFAAPQPFTADDRRYAFALVNLCGQALERARLFQRARLAAQAAAEARTLLHTFVAASPVGVAFLDAELRYLLINPTLAALNGAPVEAHLGRTLGEILPQSGELIAGYCRQVLADGRPILDAELSGELPSRPGATRTWLESFYPVHAPDGVLRGVGVVVTDITERKQAEIEREQLLAREQLARAEAEAAQARSRLLAEVSRILAVAQPNPGAVIDQVLRQLCPLLADGCGLHLLAEDGQLLRTVGAHHGDPNGRAALEQLATMPPTSDGGLEGQVARNGAALFLPVVDQATFLAGLDPVARLYHEQFPAHSLMIVPLRARERMLGALKLWRGTPGQPYGEEERKLLAEIADRVALALDNAQLYADLQRAQLATEATVARIARLQQLTAALADAVTPEDVAAVVIAEGTAVLGAQAGLMALLAADGQTLETVEATGYVEAQISPWQRFPLSAPLPASDAARSGALVLIRSLDELLERYPHLAERRWEEFQSRAAIPLSAEAGPVGVILLSFTAAQRFSPEEQNLMRLIGRHCAQALERARLYAAERSARTTAEAALKHREEFLSVAAHELKTPLTALLGQTQLLERRLARAGLLEGPHQQSVTTVVAQAERLNSMILTLLDVNRLVQGALRLEVAALDCVALVRRVVEEVEPTLSTHALRLELPPEPLPVLGDALRLEQVLHNLLSNAVKYSPSGSAVRVSLQAADAEVRLAVRDEGIGIPEEALAQLGTRFYRAPNVRSRSYSGFGIGLYIVHEIVALHQGRLLVESREHAGTTVAVFLPLGEASPA